MKNDYELSLFYLMYRNFTPAYWLNWTDRASIREYTAMFAFFLGYTIFVVVCDALLLSKIEIGAQIKGVLLLLAYPACIPIISVSIRRCVDMGWLRWWGFIPMWPIFLTWPPKKF